jgi:protein-tyrosine phosphatase
VVQLTRNVESGRRKADTYFPEVVGQSVIIPPSYSALGPALKVTLVERQSIEDARCIQSTVSITPLNAQSAESPEHDDDNDYGIDTNNTTTFTHLLYP